ncbi:MAG: glutathione peroxidase [Bacteroidia bacterium]|nr:glutathione peroxidase [Bacteroidia bacterium]MCF8425259.1 glutathione peroxidase [Bacteroidia bacterium]MCF8446519.1 glutathione peroxidase [Bacteroidia bacterium]
MTKPTVYPILVKNLQGEDISLSKYKGKVLLIVNTASECGYTPQLKSLQKLYEMYSGKDFEILAFPSNDFGGQEPLNGAEIQNFCELKYHNTFPIFNKIKVKGSDADPLYKFLSNKSENGILSMSPKWNFHKYLINKKGELVDYYLTITEPTSNKIIKKIDELLKG